MTEFSSTSASGAAGGNSRALWSLLVSFFFSWISYTGSVALIGWLVFERTRSPAVVSIAFALRFLPMAFTGVLAGVLSDRFGRRFMLVAANGAQALLSFALAIVVGVHWATAPVLILAAGAYGVADSVRLVSGMNLTYDLSHSVAPVAGNGLGQPGYQWRPGTRRADDYGRSQQSWALGLRGGRGGSLPRRCRARSAGGGDTLPPSRPIAPPCSHRSRRDSGCWAMLVPLRSCSAWPSSRSGSHSPVRLSIRYLLVLCSSPAPLALA